MSAAPRTRTGTRRAAIPLAALALAAALAGCATEAEREGPAAALATVPARPMDWSPGNWWAYHAEIGGESIDVALIVHEATETGFRLGSNLSVGFFGLPFHGNLTPEHNPRIGPEVWPLFSFPLAEGKEWAYTLFGHDARSVVRDAGEDAFQLEATSFGQTFARYDHSPTVGWFTKLDLIEPTNGTVVLSARLTAYGTDWSEAYYVEETLFERRIDLPSLPGTLEVAVPAGYLHVRGELTTTARLGVAAAELTDAAGRELASGQVVARGTDIDHIAVRTPGAATWTLTHRGAGTGFVHLQITGLSASGPLAALAPPADAPEVDLAALLQSTRPALPHEGQTTSTGAPVGV